VASETRRSESEIFSGHPVRAAKRPPEKLFERSEFFSGSEASSYRVEKRS